MDSARSSSWSALSKRECILLWIFCGALVQYMHRTVVSQDDEDHFEGSVQIWDKMLMYEYIHQSSEV